MARPIVIRDRLDHEALRLFAEQGIAQTSIRDIANAAGISQGALYRHYTGKDDLVARLFVENYVALARTLDDIREAPQSFAIRLRKMVGVFCRLFDDNVNLFRFLLLAQHGQLEHLPSTLRTPVVVVEDMVRDAMDSGDLPPGNPTLRTAMIMGLVLQTATFHVYGRLSGPLGAVSQQLSAVCLAAARSSGDPADNI